MRRLILALLLLVSSPAFAQGWTGPGQQAISYPTTSGGTVYAGVLGDGSDAKGGTPPAFATEPADIASTGFTVADWKESGASFTITGEAKARFGCNASFEGEFDPIVFPGQAMAGHWHEFIGNPSVTGSSDYASLRASTGKFTCYGGPINKSAYWTSSMRTIVNGVEVGVRNNNAANYYVLDVTEAPRTQRFMNDINAIGGVNPADPTDSIRKAEVPAGFRSTTNLDGDYNGDGFNGWGCLGAGGAFILTPDGKTFSRSWVNDDGTDRWGGLCVAGSSLYSTVQTPNCWDAKNRHSDNGRNQWRYPIVFIATGEFVCPDGFVLTPIFSASEAYLLKVDAEYMPCPSVEDDCGPVRSGFWLSSDRFGLAPENWRKPGSTKHFDIWFAWDPDVFKTFQHECLGLSFGGVTGTTRTCHTGTISATESLKFVVPPDLAWANNPIFEPKDFTNAPNSERYFPIPAGTQGDITVEHDHGS